MAKGAAMLAPAMATMLAVLTTDAAVEPADLQDALTRAVDTTFNALCVDGCTSTNDTVLVLANGARRHRTRSRAPTSTRSPTRSPRSASTSRWQMAADAEGATKLARSWCAVPAPTPTPVSPPAPSRTASSCSAR